MNAKDNHYMQLALSLAELGRGQTAPNPMVGAVLVKDGEIVGQGAHLKAGGPHAEVHALRMAGDKAVGATAYVTLEPCSHHGRTPPCADALIAAGVKRVVVAIQDPDPRVQGQGIARLRAAGIEVVTGVLAPETRRSLETYLTLKQQGRPFVTWKCAATLDGYIATSNGHSSFVTGPESRRTVHELRRSIPAIGVGVQTVIADDPQLTVRLAKHAAEHGAGAVANKQPLRVIFDSTLRMPVTAALLRQPGETLIYTTLMAEAGLATNLQRLRELGVRVVAVEADRDGRVSLQSALQDLGQRGIDGLLLEGGATLASAFMKEQFIDKVVYYIAPKLLGGGISALSGLTPSLMTEAAQLDEVTWQWTGSDLRLEGYLRYASKPTDE